MTQPGAKLVWQKLLDNDELGEGSIDERHLRLPLMDWYRPQKVKPPAMAAPGGPWGYARRAPSWRQEREPGN